MNPGSQASPGNSSASQASRPESAWIRLEIAALEKGVLDKVDFALFRTLLRRAGRSGDFALQAVCACLAGAVQSGGLRIPLDPELLAVRLQDFMNALFPAAMRPGNATRPDVASLVSLPSGDLASADNPFADLPGSARLLAESFLERLEAGAYAAILGAPPDFKPLLRTRGGLYFQKHLAAEEAVGAKLAQLLSRPDSPQITGVGPLGNFLDTVLHRFPLRLPRPVSAAETGQPGPVMVFDAKQQEALALALRKRFTVISGGPGTGKTSLAANLLRAWTRAWLAGSDPAHPFSLPRALPRIRLAAPTGRAAQRLAESLRRSLESVLHVSEPATADAADGPSARSEAGIDRFVAQLPCETLHALLRYNPGSGEYFHQSLRPLPADLVVVDEVSMVDIFALARLLEALEEGACLVLIGDMDQLPSVDSGSVLADLVPGASAPGHPLKDNLAILERSHRSRQGILDVTQRINAMDGAGALAAMGPPLPLGNWPITFLEGGHDGTGGGGCRMLSPGGWAGESTPGEYRKGWDAWLEAWVDFHYLRHSFDPDGFPGRRLATPRRASYEESVFALGRFHPPEDAIFHAGLAWKPDSGAPTPHSGREGTQGPDADFAAWIVRLRELFAYLDQARILTFTRKSWHGSVSVNRRIHERLARRWDPADDIGTGAAGGFHGCPILILENDHGKGLFNGDVGLFLRLAGRPLAFFRRADSFLAFPAAFLPRHEPAFAMTIHKSQGSEYDHALVLLPESGNRLLYKETLYTALTRARDFAGVYGPGDVFLEAVGRKVMRESGLPQYLSALSAI
jgi:exodeoxyribonuclease V alpha subunit